MKKTIIYSLFFIIFIACTAFAMEQPKEQQLLAVKAADSSKNIYINQLPPEIIGHIACMLNTVVGTTSFINYADLPVITRNIRAFSQACKAYHTYCNSDAGIKQLISAITQRFNISVAHAAANLNTPGARVLLQALPEYTVFKTLQQLIDEGKFIGTQGSCYSTNQGLLLKQHSGIQKHYSICHPWGYLQYPREYIDPKRFTLHPFDQLDEDKQQLQVIQAIADKNNASPLITLPNPLQYETQTIPSKDDMLVTSWNTCKNLAQLPTPIHQSITSLNNSLSASARQKEYDTIHDHELFLDNLHSTLFNANNRKNIHQLSDWMMMVLKRLIEQPTTEMAAYRQLSLAIRDHTYLFSQFHEMTNKTDKMHLSIQYVPGKIEDLTNINSRIHLHAHVTMPVGKMVGELLDKNEIKKNYTKTVTTLRTGWQKVRLEDNKQIAIYKSEEEWQLLTKMSTDGTQEVKLLNLIMDPLFLGTASNSASSDNTWFDEQGNLQEKNLIYLWIKKSAWESFQKQLDLKVVPEK
ncbi:MAG: hypothetical protein WCE21_02970 [Candidatus Babeliales bacterium]